MRKISKNLIAIIVGLVVGIGFIKTNEVYAAGAVMRITPVANAINIKAGTSTNYQFTLENVGDSDFKFRLYAVPYNVVNEDYDVSFTEETQYNQIIRWITFQDDSGSFVSEPTMTLKAGEKRTILYRIKVPEDIPEGGQYCMIFAESVPNGSKEDGTVSAGLDTISRVSLILLGHGEGETRNTAEITDFKLTGTFTTKSIEASTKVKNSGNIDFLTVYALSVNSIFGTPLYSVKDNFVVLPQTERKFATSWDETPLFGIFKVDFRVTAVDVEERDSHVIFIMPSFMLVILLLLLTSIIILTIMFLRKRKERSSRLVV